MIIGIAGRKGAGKTTLANGLRYRLGDDGPVSVAEVSDLLKAVCGMALIWAYPKFNADKDAPIEGAPHRLTPRDFYKFVGTEGFRRLDPDFWMRALENRYKKEIENGVLLVSGVRFPNEVSRIVASGGIVLGLTRGDCHDLHPSETEVAACLGMPGVVLLDNLNLSIQDTLDRADQAVREALAR